MLHFYTDDVAFKSSSKEGAIYDWRTCVKLCSWPEVYAEGPLSLSLSCTANCSQPCTKEWPPLFLTDFSNSFLIDVIHAPRIYPIPDVSLRSDQRLIPSNSWNSSIHYTRAKKLWTN